MIKWSIAIIAGIFLGAVLWLGALKIYSSLHGSKYLDSTDIEISNLLKIEVDEFSHIYVEGEPIKMDDLDNSLTTEIEKRGDYNISLADITVQVTLHSEAKMGVVVDLLLVLKNLELQRVEFIDYSDGGATS